MGSVKKTPAKAKKEAKPAALHSKQAPGSVVKSTTKTKKKKATPVKKVWNYTHHLPSAEMKAKNGRHEGRNLIAWNRTLHLGQRPLPPLLPSIG